MHPLWRQVIGTTARRLEDRFKEHERSFRLQNDNSSLSTHARITHQIQGSGRKLANGEHPEYQALLRNYNLRIIDQSRDALGGYLQENFHIVDNEPAINGTNRNGFAF